MFVFILFFFYPSNSYDVAINSRKTQMVYNVNIL